MKIAFLNIYGGRVNRGAERAVHELATRLSKNHQVAVFQSRDTHAFYQQLIYNSIPIKSTDVSGNFILRLLKKIYCDPYSLIVLFFSLRTLPKLLKGHYDILLPINGFWQILVCKLVKMFRGGKIVVLGYSGIGIDDYVNLKLSPDAFFSMTEIARTWAKKVNPQISYFATIPGGVDTKLIRPDVSPLNLPCKHPVVLVIAALVSYKRVDLAIKAVAKLPEVTLVLVGDGSLRATIVNLGRKLLGSRFIHLQAGFNDLAGLYAAADVFTLPSYHPRESLFSKITHAQPAEAFGIVYVEAMAANLPIVAPDDALRREIIGKAGIFVDSENIDQYATAINKALTKNWDNIPRQQALKFDWQIVSKKFEQALVAVKKIQ